MAHSDLFLPTKLNALQTAFTDNNYLLKHGNIFVKPELPVPAFPYSFFPGDIGFNTSTGLNGVPGIAQSNDAPLDFAIKHEKPPTPPASTSPINSKTPPSTDEKNAGDQSKNAMWILGKQKLSWDNSTVASYNPETKMFRCVVCNAVGFLSRIAEHYLGTHTSAKVFQCLHCPYSSTWSRCVRMHMAKHHGVPNAPPSLWKGQPLLEEIFQLLTNLKTTVDSQGRDRADPDVSDKKFVCPKCPYTTDRRDLYLRHENIHKEDKPYHCYICFKLFNRADHVKKHFLRIHRGHPYDISLVRRRPPRVSSSSYSSGVKNLNESSLAPKSSSDLPVANQANTHIRNAAFDTALKDSNGTLPHGSNGYKQAKGFDCPFCSWEGADAWCLRRHMNVHIKTYGCPICEFKSSKAERLFTHVYKFHRMLVCTKCKYVTDQAHRFENHIQECCVEIILGPQQLKQNVDDSANESDTSSSPEVKHKNDSIAVVGESKVSSNGEHSIFTHTEDNTGRFSSNPSDIKASVSIIPLHNSVSYCFPVQRSPIQVIDGMSTFCSSNVIDAREVKADAKVEIKSELASPVQSSSDSGLPDLIIDQNDLDLTCWHCGCEFADEPSLNTHTELYHRNNKVDKTAEPQRQKMKFSCALCNFSSNEQRTILDHMRFHTGETLVCRAVPSCAFTTIFDSTLREHVLKEHTDSKPRCPHCGLHCKDRITFIRHYRKCHHSTSCYRCRNLKHSFKTQDKNTSSSMVQPYLHHNPYSKTNSTGNIHHRNNDVRSPCKTEFISHESISQDECLSPKNLKGRRSRKQSTPRKLVQPLPKNGAHSPSGHCCDKNVHKVDSKNEAFLGKYMEKLRIQHASSLWCCKKCHRNPLCYKKKANFLLHCLWFHHSDKFRCKKCKKRFAYNYQVVIHKRRYHESQ